MTRIKGLSPTHGRHPIRRRVVPSRLGLKDFFLDYAGRQPPKSPVHAALTALQPGSALFPKQPGELADAAGVTVVLLSQTARQNWAARWQRIEKITALARRYAEDSAPEYQARLRCEQWEVPVV